MRFLIHSLTHTHQGIYISRHGDETIDLINIKFN